MTDTPKTRFPYAALAALFLIILGGYLGAYSALVTPSLVIDRDQPQTFIMCLATPQPSYPRGGALSEVFFRPANALDRIFRPQRWRQIDLHAAARQESAEEEMVSRLLEIQPTSAAKR